MRLIVSLLLVSMVAVLAASTLGTNDGLVSMYWRGWRVDVSLNLFIVTLLLGVMAVYLLLRGMDSLWTLPSRAQQWRTAQRDKSAQGALREALALYLAGRYARAHKTAKKAVRVHHDTAELPSDLPFLGLAHQLSAVSLHRLRDRAQRDLHLKAALQASTENRKDNLLEEGTRLLAAEFAVDDRQPVRAMQELALLPPGVARRTQALRIKLNAARQAQQPMEALRAARLLIKHQGFAKDTAQGLLRSLVKDVLKTARDADQLRHIWQNLEAAERQDPFIAADAAMHIGRMGHHDEARAWLSPVWHGIERQPQEVVNVLSEAMRANLSGLEANWLPRLDDISQAALRMPALGVCVGLAFFERGLWGKARTFLLSAAYDDALDADSQRLAWRALATLAEQEMRQPDALLYWKAAATLERPAR